MCRFLTCDILIQIRCNFLWNMCCLGLMIENYLAFMFWEYKYYFVPHLCCAKLSILVSCFVAGLVSLVVFRDVFLVGGAVFLRANSLGWKVQPTWFSSFPFCFRNCVVMKMKWPLCVFFSGKAGLIFLTLMGPAAKRLNHSF